MDLKRFPELLRAIYDAVDGLEAMFPARLFTADGHLVRSLGEALAAYRYGIELAPASCRGDDGLCCGRQVPVKATQGDGIALSSEPEHLLVIKCWRRCKSEPPRRPNIEPGVEADFGKAGCG